MNKISRFYKTAFRNWQYFLLGMLFLTIFTFFNGLNVVMVKPLFDYIFIPKNVEVKIDDTGEFFDASNEAISEIMEEHSLFEIFSNKEVRGEFANHFDKIFNDTDPLLLLYILAVFILFLYLAKSMFFILQKTMFVNLQGKTIKTIRNWMYSRYLNQSMAFFSTNKVGDSLVRMVNDVNIINRQLLMSSINVIRDVFQVVFLVLIAMFINTKLFLISLVIVPVFTFCVDWLGKKIKKYAKRIQNQFSDMFSTVEEVLNNMKVVKAFSKEKREYDNFKKINNKYFGFWRRAQIYAALNRPISEINSAVVGVIILIIGGQLVLNDPEQFSFGSFFAFLFAMFSTLHPIKNLTKAYADIRKGLVSLDRVFYVLDNIPEVKEAEQTKELETFKDKIELQNVNFGYDSDQLVLKDINLTFNKGEQVAIVGSSGSGKTTLINLILRMFDPTEGNIYIDKVDIKDLKLDNLRKMFGIVTQNSYLFSDTINFNIEYGRRNPESKMSIEKAAEIAYADIFIKQFPEGYEHVLSQKADNLSGGQQQRLCIARAIIDDPPVIIFDEATSALDTESERNVQMAIEKVTEERTVIVIAHRLSTILSSDKIVVLDEGKIVGIGTNEELLQNCPKYKTLYDMQFNL